MSRTVSDLAKKLVDASSPNEAVMVCITPEDNAAVHQFALLCEWMRENGAARAGFETFRAMKKAKVAGGAA